MPYFNETLNIYQCYPLLTQGPCEPNEWFVLEESQPNKTVCVEKPCIGESNSQELGDSLINFNYEDGSTTDTQRFQMTKTRQKLHKTFFEIAWVRQQFDKFLKCSACNQRKRKLCKSAEIDFEKIRESTSGKLIFGGF